VEIGAGHYPFLVILHASWLAALWFWLLSGHAMFSWPAGVAYLLVEIARAWVMLSLGRFWTTRILVPREMPLVRAGPYRYVRHPNYWVVAAEIGLLPLALGVWPLALVFSTANAMVLAWRIRIENATLRPRREVA
jgi:methyltransferase